MRTLFRLFLILLQVAYQISRYLLGCGLQLLLLFTSGRRRRIERLDRLRAVCLTAFFRNLGGTFVKVGQILSSRPDLLPPLVVAELESLQDHVPPFGFDAVREVVEGDLGRPLPEVFADLNEVPVAAASIAQVHEGHLLTGEHVAVKVQRPNVAGDMERDLRILRSGARLLDLLPWLRSLALPKLAAELGRAIGAQLDFPQEVRNNRRFAENFRDIPWVRLPKIYDEQCGRRTITMSFVEGKKLTAILDDPPLDRRVMAERIFELYLTTAFKHFFMHADLHPGNILVERDGGYVLIDTGLVAEIPEHYVRKFFRVSLAFATLDGRLIGEAYLDGCELSDERREAALADMERLGERYQRQVSANGGPNGNAFLQIDMAEATTAILALLRRHRIYMDPEWTGLMLSDVTFEGIAKMLDADIDFMALVMRGLPEVLSQTGVLSMEDPVVQAVLRGPGGAAVAASPASA